jgi:hypothetical protein
MSNKRITDLTELTTPTTDDVFPIVDIATNTTQKVQVGNLPIQTAVTTALATKQATLVSGTNIKTVNSTTLLGSGDIAVQPTLVSGTNIKTLNSVSLLGSGDIVLAATPSGVAGAIQFSNGSAFASDAANLFWDDTNNRLGIGTNAPTAILQAQNATNGVLLARFKDAFASTSYIDIKNDATLNEYTGLYWGSTYRILAKDANPMFINCATTVNFADGFSTRMAVTSSEVQIGSITGARLGIKGTGSTSATTSLLVQNSAGASALAITDDLVVRVPTLTTTSGNVTISGGTVQAGVVRAEYFNTPNNGFTVFQTSNANGNAFFYQSVSIGSGVTPVASAALDVVSTSKGFLPPRMTTTEKGAIASPATGLVLYDTTTNKLQCYNGTTWNDLF